jgi:class 3 adenylate cyclase
VRKPGLALKKREYRCGLGFEKQGRSFMKKRPRYRFYVWVMILSGVILAGALVFTSLSTLRADKGFSRIILDENKAFLVNTLRFGHGMMARMRDERYKDLIDLALKSKFIRYLAILDDEGKVVSQSDPPPGLKVRDAYDVDQLGDGFVLEETKGLLLVAYKAEETDQEQMPMRRRARMMTPRTENHEHPDWYLVALDVSGFERHYHHTVIQTVITGAAILLFALLIIVASGIIQRYELAHISLEKLERIKSVLSHFVPETAKRIIEKDPGRAVLERYLQDATVLFLDVEGFTTLVQRHPQERVNLAIESYFSVFFDLIQKRQGDINETAGDGMMVIFLHTDPHQHARNAAQAAVEIHKHCEKTTDTNNPDLPRIRVNIGISSGEVYLGSTKLRGTEGNRWTFTASGSVTILAARLADYSRGGQILISEETARRLEQNFLLKQLGRIPLKNLEDSGEVYQIAS